jgi:hypothetical protein
MSEGEFYAERMGWRLPSFDLSILHSRPTPMTSLTSSGIEISVAAFHVNIDPDLDVPLSAELDAPAGTVARAMIWING